MIVLNSRKFLKQLVNDTILIEHSHNSDKEKYLGCIYLFVAFHTVHFDLFLYIKRVQKILFLNLFLLF